MTTDTYSIQVAVDSTSAVTATRNLTAMEQATGRSERALSSLGSVAKIAGSALAGISIASLARDILKINIEFENMRAQLLSVTGSSVMAAKAMADIQKISRETPQSLQEITKSYMMLKNFGIEPTIQVMRDLTNITSKVGGDSDTLSGIIRQLGQAYAKNKLQAEDANSIIERGIPIYSLLSQVTGKTTSEVLKMMEAGKITRPVIEDLIHAMGSSAVDASANKMQTLGGKVDMLGEAWHNFEDVLLNDKASGILGNIVSGMIKSIDYLTERFGTSVGKQIADLEVSVAAAKKNIPENKNSASYAAANESYMQQQIMLDQLKRQKQLADAEASTTTEKIKNDKNIQKSQDETIRLRDLEIKRVKEFGTATQQENQALKEAKDTYGEVTASMKEQIHQKYFHKDITAAQTKLTKEESAAKKEAAKATKDLAEAERYFNEQLNAQVASAENAGKLFAAQQQTKIAALEAERVSIQGKAAIEYESAKTYEEKSRILNESQSATNLLLAKEKEIRDSLTNQSAETIDAKIAAAQAELDNAGKYNLTLAEQLRLKTEIAGLQTDKAVLAETSTQSDIKAKSDAEQKANKDKIDGIKAIEDAQRNADEQATARMAVLTSALENAKEAANGLKDAFGSIGEAIGGVGVAIAQYEKNAETARQEYEKTIKNLATSDISGNQKAEAKLQEKLLGAQIKLYGDLTQSAQNFFKKGTTGYQVLGAATKVFRAFEMVQSAMSMSKQIADMGKTVAMYLFGETAKTTAKVTSSTASVAADTVGAGASATKAVADSSQGDPYTGLARGAMMLAFMVAIGAMAGGGGSAAATTMTGADYLAKETDKYKSSQGGTVLGSDAMSNSILDALDTISSNSSADLDYTKGMARSLEVLSYAMKGVATTIARNYSVDTSSLGLGTSTSGFFMTTTTTKEFAGSGITFVKDTLGNIVKEGIIAGRNYIQTLVTETDSGFLGIGASTKQFVKTKWSPLNDEISASIAYSLGKVQENVISLAGAFGQEAADKLKNFEIDLGKMPLGKDAAANTEIINAALSKQADLMAIIANYSYKDFQQVGEGYFQTLNRVSTAITTAQTKLKAMGIVAIEYTGIINKQGDVENEMVTKSLQLSSSFKDVNEILGKLPGTADDKIEAFKGLNLLKESFASIGLGSTQLTQDMVNVAGGISAFSSTLSDFAKSMMSPEKLANANASKMQENLWSLGFINMPKLTSNAQDAIDVYKYIVQEAAKDTTEAGNYILTKLILMGSDFAAVAEESAKYVTDATTEINANIKKEQDLIVKSTDQRINILKKLGELDPAAKEEALRIEREKAMQGMDGATASYTQALNMLTDAMTELNAATIELNTAYKALIAMRDKYSTIATMLKSYLDELNGTASDYDNARTLFLKTSELAKSGNEQALQDMTNVSKAFLSASKSRSDAEIQAAQDSVNTAKSALTSAQDALAQAQEDQSAAQLQASKDALLNQKQALADQVSALKESVSTITAFKDKLLNVSKSLGSYLKELTNESQNYDEAKAEFLRIAALAKAGDEQALQDLENVAKDFLSISKTQIDESTKLFNDAVDASKTGLKTAYDAVVALRDKFKSIRQSLVDYKLEITGAGTPQGSPESVYQSTKKAFEDAKVLAAGGNEQALADLPNAAKSFLDASLKYNATGMDYQADYQSVLASLDTSIAKVDSQIDILNKQLLAAESADKSLIDLNASALLIDEAIKAYKTALESESQAASIRYKEDKTLVIANATEVKANADLQIANSNKQIEKLNEQITLANTQIGQIDEQLALFTSATKLLASIDYLTLQANNAQNALNSAMAAQAAVDTTRYETDKETVKKNVEDALKNANSQIEIMNKQLTAAETANAKLEDLKTKTDTVDGGISRLSTAVNDYISADLTFSNALAMNKTLLTDLSDVIKQSEINIINQQAAASAAAAQAAAAQAQAMAIAAQDTASLRATNIVSAITLSNAMSDITVKPYANGGMASGLSLVGEQGAELVNFTSPANVTSHQQTTGLFDSIGNAIDDQSVLLKEQVVELRALVNLQSNANTALINEMQGMKEELNTISRKAKLEAAA